MRALLISVLAGATALAGVSSALATMPMLSDRPKPATYQSCIKWAEKQDEDAHYMWGTLESGESSDGIGMLRLALSCMGERPPEIVGFHSSIGVAEAYCKRHRAAGICRNR